MTTPAALPGRIRCLVTRYRVLDGELHEDQHVEHSGYHVSDGWLWLHNSSASGPVEDLLAGAREGKGWSAQAGAPPVYVNGRWGGRVWPKIYVDAPALLEVLS